MKKVSCRLSIFVPEISNYSRGVFFRKVRSFYSLLSIYSERIFFCKKKVSRKPLSFVPEVSNSSRWEINYSEFLKAPRQMVWEVSNYSRGIFIFGKIRSSYSLLSIYSEGIFVLTKKVSRKPLSFVPEVSINSRGEINYSEFLKTPPAKEYEKCPIIVGGFFEKVR